MTKIVPKLNLNKHPRDCDDYSLVNANNIVFNNDNTVITNEFDLEKINLIFDNDDTIIVGSIACSTEVVLFTNYGEIYRVYDNKYFDKEITVGNRPSTIIKVPYEKVIDNFDYHGGQIKGAYTYNVNGHLIISFSEYDTEDNVLVPLKVINLDKPDDDNSKYPICPEVKIPTVSSVSPTYDNWYKSIDYLFIRYKINDYDYTQWFALNKTVYCDKFYREVFIDTQKGGLLSTEPNKPTNGNPTQKVINMQKFTDISDKYEITNCGYKVVLSGLDTRYKSYQLGIISSTKDDTKAFITSDLTTTVYNINGHTVKKYNVGDLIKSYYNYYNVRNIINYKNKLYISNYNEKSDNEINNNVELTLTKNNIDIDSSDNFNKITINYKTVNIKYNNKIYKKWTNNNEYTCYVPEINKDDINYDILNTYFSDAIPIMWLYDYNSGYSMRFNPKNNEKPNYYTTEQYITYIVFHTKDNFGIGAFTVCFYKNIFYKDKKLYFAYFKNENEQFFNKFKEYYNKNSDVYDEFNVVVNNDNTFIYSMPFHKDYTFPMFWIGYYKKSTFTCNNNIFESFDTTNEEGRLQISSEIFILNNNYITINTDNLKYSFNLLNNRGLIPDQYYSFYIHYIDKYGKITNGYPITNIYGQNDIIQSTVIEKEVTKTNGIKVTLYYDYNYSLILYIDESYNMKKYYELLCALRDYDYTKLPEKYIIPVERMYLNETVEKSASNEPRIQGFIKRYFDKVNIYDDNIIETFNTDETLKEFFTSKIDGLDDTMYDWSWFACTLEYNVEYKTTIFYEDYEVIDKDNNVKFNNNINNTIVKIPSINENLLTEIQSNDKDITKFDSYGIIAKVDNIPEGYIGWFISYEKFEPVSEISGYCKKEDNYIYMYSSLFDTNDKIAFNFNILKGLYNEYKILDYKLLPANSCNNIGYSTKLRITLSDDNYESFAEGIYKLYNTNYESLYNNTNKILIPCTNITYSVGEFNFNNTNGNIGDYNGCLSKIESIIYEEATILNTANVNVYNIQGEVINTTDGENGFITVKEHYDYNTTFNQLKRFNNNPKIYAQVTNPYDEQYKWKYNAIRYVEPQDTVDLFKQWYNPIDEQYPKVFVNYRTEDLNIDRFDKTIRSSNVIADETAEINWRKFNTEDYKNLTYNKGNITNLIGIGDKFYVHTEHSLFVLDVNNYLANGNKNVQLEDKQPFEVNFKEIFTTNVGFGGLQDDRAFIIGKFGYIWFDNDSNRFMCIDGNNDFKYIDNNIFKWYEGNTITDVRFGEDIRYNRLFVKFNNEDAYNVLTYNYIVNEFISAYGNENAIKFDNFVNSKTKLYIINNNKNEVYNIDYINNCPYIPKFAVIVNTKFELIKYLEFISYKLHVTQNSKISIYDYSPVEGRNILYSGNYLSIFNEFVNTNKIDLTVNEDAKEDSNLNEIMNYEKPRFDLGNWNLNFIFDNSHDSNIITADKHSRLYGNYFIIEFELATDRRWEFEELNVQLTNKRI